MLVIELAASFVGVLAFSAALPTVRQMRLCYSFTSAEEISLIMLFGVSLCGAKDITQIGFINIANVFCILIVIIFSLRLGSSRGAVAGLTMGLVSSLGGGIVDTSCTSFAFAGMSAGFFGRWGAIPGCSAFILANALITALANGSTEVLINIYDIFAACLLYAAIPAKLLDRLSGFGARNEAERAAMDVKSYGEYVTEGVLSCITRLSERLEGLDKSQSLASDSYVHFLERIARRSCNGCGMRRLCWNRDIQKTCDSLRLMLENYNSTGELDNSLLPKNCLRPNEVKESFLHMNELYRSDLMWTGKLNELRHASRSQLRALAEIMRASSSRMESVSSIDRTLADDIARKLLAANISADNVTVLRDSELDPTVTLTLSSCNHFALCDNAAAKTISEACGKKMVRAGRRDCSSCKITYVAAPNPQMSFAAEKRSRGGSSVSGDTALFRVINKSLCAAVLCDGMGSGEKARSESRAAAETLLDLIETGMDGETAMETVNSLFLPFGETSCSAADLCIYDAKSGRVKIIKCGGAASFSKSGDRVDAMYSKSMPLGATAKKDVETFSFSVSGGDMIVMITDGVLESAAKDGWLISEMERYRGDDPHRLCDIILESAVKKGKSSPRDDVTVLAGYIEKQTAFEA
jgi:stage II sporulation protein E